MSISLATLAELIQGRLHGDPETPITGAATLAAVEAGQITLADCADKSSDLANCSASAAIVTADVPLGPLPAIVVEDVHAAFSQIVEHFRPRRIQKNPRISEHAIIDPSAQIAEGVDIRPLAIIGEDVVIGRGSVVHSGAHILAGCVLGEEVTLFPNVILYDDTRIGDRSIIHAGAVLGAFGFGYRQNEGKHELSSQLGFVEIEDDVEVGACVTIDRGTYGPTVIGEGTKIDNLVQIAHNCRLGKHNLICSQVGIAGSTTTGDQVVMAGQVGVRDHVHIGTGAILCSKAGIPNDVGDGQVMFGAPAVPLRRQKLQMAAISKLPEMRRQFRAMQRQLAALEKQLDPGSSSHSDDQAA